MGSGDGLKRGEEVKREKMWNGGEVEEKWRGSRGEVEEKWKKSGGEVEEKWSRNGIERGFEKIKNYGLNSTVFKTTQIEKVYSNFIHTLFFFFSCRFIFPDVTMLLHAAQF